MILRTGHLCSASTVLVFFVRTHDCSFRADRLWIVARASRILLKKLTCAASGNRPLVMAAEPVSRSDGRSTALTDSKQESLCGKEAYYDRSSRFHPGAIRSVPGGRAGQEIQDKLVQHCSNRQYYAGSCQRMLEATQAPAMTEPIHACRKDVWFSSERFASNPTRRQTLMRSNAAIRMRE